MAGKKDNLPFGLAAAADSDKDFKQELGQMEEAYYDYLVTPLFTAGELSGGNDAAVAVFSRELAKVEGITSSGEIRTQFIADMIGDEASKPKIGARQLPSFFTKGHAISEIYDLVLSNKDLEVWKKRGYDVMLEIEIAQCRALHRYKLALEARIKKASVKIEQTNGNLSFQWLKETEKLDKLYEALKKDGIIECEKTTFRIAFGNSLLTGPLNIRWKLITRNLKYTSKASLFYFLDKLVEKGYMHPFRRTGSLKTIEKIFCKKDGELFENLGQSEGSMVKEADMQRIDNVINSLK